MTLLNITNQLYGLLCATDILTAKELATIKLPAEYSDERDSLIRTGLEQLVEDGLVREGKSSSGDSYWILIRPLDSSGQDIHLSVDVSVAIADVINTFLDANDAEGDRCDASNLSENDIVSLIQIIGNILNTGPNPNSGGAN